MIAAVLSATATSPASAKPYPPPSIHLLCTAAANNGTLEGSVCALQGATDVTCWSDPTQPPAALSGVGQVLKLVAGPSAICAILTDHTARCWGNIALGESIAPDAGVANFSSATPIALDGAVDIQDMAIGYTHVCVLHSDGSVECKGGNRDGELGDGTMVTRGTFAHVAW